MGATGLILADMDIKKLQLFINSYRKHYMFNKKYKNKIFHRNVEILF